MNATITIEIVARTWRPNADTWGDSRDFGEWGSWDVAYTGNIGNAFHSEQDALLAILALRAQGGDWNTDIEYGLQVEGAAHPYSEGL